MTCISVCRGVCIYHFGILSIVELPMHSQRRNLNRAAPGLGVQDLHDSIVMLGVEPGHKLIVANRMALAGPYLQEMASGC